MFYVMTSDEINTGAMIMDRPELPELGDIEFGRGRMIAQPIPPFDLHMDKDSQGELLDFVWVAFPALVISDAFRARLAEVGVDNIQYYPIRIVNDITGEVHQRYFVGNIVGRIACLDLGTSQVTRRAALPDKIRSIEEMHLDESRIGDVAIFRLHERSTIVVVNEAVRNAIVEAGLTGCAFTPAEGYSTL